MVNRINLLLKAKNITARQFAEEIGIQPSGMSHILSGRNNPSLDFVMKVIRRYPEIDINWLMFGKGEMYEAHPYTQPTQSLPTPTTPKKVVAAPRVAPQPAEAVQPDLFSQPVENRVNDLPPHPTFERPTLVQESAAKAMPEERLSVAVPASPIAAAQVVAHVPQTVVTQANTAASNVAQTDNVTGQGRKLVRLLAFYDDHTFIEYRPQ